MEFSSEYLENMLGSAIEFHNLSDNKIENIIPDKIKNPLQAVDIFTNCLKKEAHRSFKQTTNSKEPILYTVNLDSDNPGIVVEVDKQNSKLKIYNKVKYTEPRVIKKKKVYKDDEDLKKKALKELEKIKNKEHEIFEKQDYKSNQTMVNKSNKEINKLKKDLNKIEDTSKILEEQITELKKENKESSKKYNQLTQKKDNLQIKKAHLDSSIDHRNKNIEEKEEKIKNYEKNNEIKMLERELKKKERLEKSQKKKEEKLMKENNNKGEEIMKEKNNKEDEIMKISSKDNLINENDNLINEYDNKKDELTKSEQKNEKKKKLNQLNVAEINDDLFEIINQYKSDQNNNTYEQILENIDQVKLYPSPIPFERHIRALDYCDPNPILLPTLLYGDQSICSDSIKIIHGPPGTGKTSRLIKELQNLLAKNKNEKILLCAPSNTGVINLYNRAKSFGIEGCLILSSNKLPKDFKLPEKQGKENIVFTTISMRFGKILNKIKFTKIIMDEASQCQEAWCWGLLRSEVNKIIMAGDPFQLPSLVSDEGGKYKYNRSLMERLMGIGVSTELLDVQRRMHPDIAEFSNVNYYDGKLKSDYQYHFDIPPIQILHVQGKEEKIDNSFQNELEVKRVIHEYNNLKQIFNEVIVISPYQAQCNLIKKLNNDINVHTIDSFQGKESEAVIITTVRSDNKVGFWNEYKRLNVALTRAKHALRIIGNTKTWSSEKGPLNDFLCFAKHKNTIQY